VGAEGDAVSDGEPTDRDFFRAVFRWFTTGESKLDHEPREEEAKEDREEGPQVIEAEGEEVSADRERARRAPAA
jgi:hypothetical protein